MAAIPAPPWSRWDPPGQVYRPPPPVVDVNRPFGDGPVLGAGVFQPFVGTTVPTVVQGRLIGQEVDPTDSDFLRCIYGIPNGNRNSNQIVLQCAQRLGCCNTGCCYDTAWEVQYAWAIALAVLVGLLLLLAIAAWLCCWLFNRSKDKHQKKELLASNVPSAAQSQVSVAGGGNAYTYPASVNNGYYPYVGGPGKTNGRY